MAPLTYFFPQSLLVVDDMSFPFISEEKSLFPSSSASFPGFCFSQSRPFPCRLIFGRWAHLLNVELIFAIILSQPFLRPIGLPTLIHSYSHIPPPGWLLSNCSFSSSVQIPSGFSRTQDYLLPLLLSPFAGLLPFEQMISAFFSSLAERTFRYSTTRFLV